MWVRIHEGQNGRQHVKQGRGEQSGKGGSDWHSHTWIREGGKDGLVSKQHGSSFDGQSEGQHMVSKCRGESKGDGSSSWCFPSIIFVHPFV